MLSADLQKAVDHLSSASLNLSNYRSQFAEVKNEANNVCAKCGVLAKFAQKIISERRQKDPERLTGTAYIPATTLVMATHARWRHTTGRTKYASIIEVQSKR